jgi:hypothetical protein
VVPSKPCTLHFTSIDSLRLLAQTRPWSRSGELPFVEREADITALRRSRLANHSARPRTGFSAQMAALVPSDAEAVCSTPAPSSSSFRHPRLEQADGRIGLLPGLYRADGLMPAVRLLLLEEYVASLQFGAKVM